MTAVTALLYWLNHAPLWHRTVRVWGQRVRGTSLDRLLCLGLHRLGWMGRAERRFLERRVRPGMCVVDVGANVGLYALLLARLAGPAGQVFAFEPEPALFAALADNCRRCGLRNLTPLNLALGERRGRVSLYRSAFNTGDNRLGGLGWSGHRVEVGMTRLDDVLGGRAVDFIKMDVQGHELAVLRGMDGLLRTSPRLEISLEFWPAGLRAAGTAPAQLLDHLGQRGFRVYAPVGDDLEPVTDVGALERGLTGWRHVDLLATRLGLPTGGTNPGDPGEHSC